MERVKNLLKFLGAVACFCAAVVREAVAGFFNALCNIPDAVRRVPDASGGFWSAFANGVGRMCRFVIDKKAAKSVEKIQREFVRGSRRSRQKGSSLFSTRMRRFPGAENYRRMLARWAGGITVGFFFVGFVAGGGMFAYFPSGWVVACAVSVLLVWVLLNTLGHQMRGFHLGSVGERKMAQHLERMIGFPDFFVYHGVSAKYGDIDHVLVCPKGVFCIEVKVLAPRYEGDNVLRYEIEDDETTGRICRKAEHGDKKEELDSPNPCKQAARNAVWLYDHIIEKTGERPGFVKRIVYFPERKVERKGEHRMRDEFVSGDPGEIVRFLNSLPEERNEELTKEENQANIRRRMDKIREVLDGESERREEEIPF